MTRRGGNGPRRGGSGVRRGSLRVVSGTAGGLRLDTPASDGTRPTADRVREAVFNSLESLGVLDGAVVLDAFAGSGALGIEALSRGAARAVFAESDPLARSIVESNLATTGFTDRATVVGSDGAALLRRGPWDLVLLDPPYRTAPWEQLMVDLVAGLAEWGVAVLESDVELTVPEELEVLRSRRYAGTVVTLVNRSGAES